MMPSTVEAGMGTNNAKQAAPVHQMLIKQRQPQPSTPIQRNKLIAYGIVTKKIIPKATKAMDLQIH